MFVLFTDFTFQGPYVGQLKAVLHGYLPQASIVDLMHDAPVMDPRRSAFLLEPLCRSLPPGCVVIGVVDPGVGTERPGCLIQAGERFYVGPDNGLFEFVVRRSESVRYWRLPVAGVEVAPTFHGRDVFAPVAAAVLRGEMPEDGPHPADRRYKADWGDDTPQVLYVDGYGNGFTGIRSQMLSDSAILEVGSYRLMRADTFARFPHGAGMWHRNSSGLVEISVNGGRADDSLGFKAGSQIRLIRP